MYIVDFQSPILRVPSWPKLKRGKLVEFRSVLYTSEAQLYSLEEDKQVELIAVTSRINNEMSGITGCLVYTGIHFAQIVEGGSAAIGRLLIKLQVDSRHRNMKIISDAYQSERVFLKWSMAYIRTPQLRSMIERVAEGKVEGSSAIALADIIQRTMQNASGSDS